jgi:hypothetical protein
MDDITLFFMKETSKIKNLYYYSQIKIREQKNGFAIIGQLGPNLSNVLYKVKLINGKIKVLLRKTDIQLGGTHEFESKELAMEFLNNYFLNLHKENN